VTEHALSLYATQAVQKHILRLAEKFAHVAAIKKFIDTLDFTADATFHIPPRGKAGGEAVRVRIWTRYKDADDEVTDLVVWEAVILSRDALERERAMWAKAIEDKVVSALESYFDVMAQMHFARLSRALGGGVKATRLVKDTPSDVLMLEVTFKNGHTTDVPESRAATNEFLAQCMLVYTLPPRD
jgi:hypothetical protein